MNKVELISESRSKEKEIHGDERIFCYFIFRNVINGRSVLDIADKCKENWKDECKNILCEIFYVVTVFMSRNILEDQIFWDNTGLM